MKKVLDFSKVWATTAQAKRTEDPRQDGRLPYETKILEHPQKEIGQNSELRVPWGLG
jgi:hypothetical protein